MGRYLALLGLLALATACSRGEVDPVAEGGRLFGVYCAGCHSRDPAGPTAAGPSTAQMVARAAAHDQPATWLRQAIVAPDSEVAPGYQPGLMPATYGQSLRPEQLDALVAYLLAPE